jgi:methylmalonyl-CoA mutase
MEKQETNYDVLKIDNAEVRVKQIARINQVKAARDEKACQ